MLEIETIAMHLKRCYFFRNRKKRIFANTSRGYKKAFNPRDNNRSQKYFLKAHRLAQKMLDAGRVEVWDQYLDLIFGD